MINLFSIFFFFMFLSIKSQKKIMKNTHQSSLDCQKIWQPRLLISHFLLLFYFWGGVVVQSLKVRNITNSFQLSIIHLVAVLTFTKIWAVVALICMCFCLMSVFYFFFPASKSSVWMSCFAVLLVSVLESAKQVHRKKYDIIKIYTWSKGSYTTWTLNITVLNI